VGIAGCLSSRCLAMRWHVTIYLSLGLIMIMNHLSLAREISYARCRPQVGTVHSVAEHSFQILLIYALGLIKFRYTGKRLAGRHCCRWLLTKIYRIRSTECEWSGLNWLRTGSSGAVRTLQWTFEFHETRINSFVAEVLLASEEELWFHGVISLINTIYCKTRTYGDPLIFQWETQKTKNI
jgi:hypothetical protein